MPRAFARLAWRDNVTGPLTELEKAAWNLAEWRDHSAPWEKRPIAREARIAELLTQARRMAEMWPDNEARWHRCILVDIVERLERAKAAGVFDPDGAESEIVSIRQRLADVRLSKRTAAGQAWTVFQEAVRDFVQDANADLASHLRDELWKVVEAYQDAKRESGYLDFADLLLYARDLLRHEGARPELQARYDRIFVDEFQDTDPILAEILTTLAPPENLFVVARRRHFALLARDLAKRQVLGEDSGAVIHFPAAEEGQEGASTEVGALGSPGIMGRDSGALQSLADYRAMTARVAHQDGDLVKRDCRAQRAARDFDEFERFAGSRKESDAPVRRTLRGAVAGQGKTLDGLERGSGRIGRCRAAGNQVGGSAVYKSVAKLPFGNSLEFQAEEQDGSWRNGARSLYGELDSNGIIGEIKAGELGLICLEERREIGAARPVSRSFERGTRSRRRSRRVLASAAGKPGKRTTSWRYFSSTCRATEAAMASRAILPRGVRPRAFIASVERA